MAAVISTRRRSISGVLKVKSGGRIKLAPVERNLAPGKNSDRIAARWDSFSQKQKIHFILQAAFPVKGNPKQHDNRDLVKFIVENYPEKVRTYEGALRQIRVLQSADIRSVRTFH